MKIQVIMPDEKVEYVDFCAKQMGLSRSAFCAMSINEMLRKYEKKEDVFVETTK